MKQSTSYRFVQESYDSDRPQPVATKAVESKEIPRNFFKYTVSGPQFRPVGDVVLTETLTPGSYKIGHDMSGMYLEQVKSNTDEMMVFEDSPMHKAVAEIATFWDRKDHYKKLGLMQSRGIILYGPPGSGKSLALQQVGEAMAKKGDIMLMANSPDQISSALSAVRQIEPERRIVVTFEEADELASYDERTLLRLMDGDLKVDRVCYLATTNYIDRLSPRLQRPGRFDKRIYVGPPKFEHRLKYLNHKLKGIAEDSQIQDMAKKTEGLSFGHLRELIAGAFAIGDPVDEVIMRLRDSRNIKESQKQKQKQAVNERMLSELDLYSWSRFKKPYEKLSDVEKQTIDSLRESRKKCAISRILG